jgi:surface protein
LGTYKGTQPSLTHTYAISGDYSVRIRGKFPQIDLSSSSAYASKLQSVDQWGDIQWNTMRYAFYRATNVQILATDTPNLSKVTDMSYMFYSATNLTGNFSGWDTSKVTNMYYMFHYATNFN